MSAFAVIGMVVVGLAGVFTAFVAAQVAWNIHWGIRGAWRLRHILKQRGKGKVRLRWVFRAGLRNWAGGKATYWVVDGGQHVPVDPRYPVEEWYPA